MNKEIKINGSDTTLLNGNNVTDLALIPELQELSVMDNKKLAQISERMKEMDRANQALSKKNTQTTGQLMTLTMLCDAPYRRLRQVLAMIEKKRAAIESSVFALRKKKIQLKRYSESEDELLKLKAEQIQHGFQRAKTYLEASLKEIAMYQESYDEIKKTYNIPDNWDELDLEKEEISNHIRMAFRNCIRNVLVSGGMNMGTMEYLEQFGIHPVTAKKLIMDYLNEVESMIGDGKYPSVTHLYEFLDRCADIFQDAHLAVMSRIGISSLLKDDYLFTEMRDTV